MWAACARNRVTARDPKWAERGMNVDRIAVLGAGAWGTALALTAARAGREVTLWEQEAANAEWLAAKRESRFLPGVRLDDTIAVTRALAEAVRAQAILLAVPAQVTRAVAAAIAPLIAPGTPLIACAKGIERGTRKFMTEIIEECAPHAVPAILSGPSFAVDVARGLPTAVTLAADDAQVSAALSQALATPRFRPYQSTDRRGAEIGGATKNVLAIAAGIVTGRGLGASAAAALTTRGFAELMRFGRAYGARPETMTGLSGLGDLILTCSSPQSRNFSFGVSLGRGEAVDDIRSKSGLVEGTFTAPVLLEMARARDVEMPIVAAVAEVLAGRLSVDQAIESLLARPVGAEV
jgi:glycerol-3-phosphate dehydrogenase (NAD(P)+)